MRDFLKKAGVRIIPFLIIGTGGLILFGKINWAVSFLAGLLLASVNILSTSLNSLSKKTIFLYLGKYIILSFLILLLLFAKFSAVFIAIGFTIPLIVFAWQGIKEAK